MSRKFLDVIKFGLNLDIMTLLSKPVSPKCCNFRELESLNSAGRSTKVCKSVDVRIETFMMTSNVCVFDNIFKLGTWVTRNSFAFPSKKKMGQQNSFLNGEKNCLLQFLKRKTWEQI